MRRPEYLSAANPELVVRLDHFAVTNPLLAFFRMAIDRFHLKFRTKDLTFHRLLGTGSGQTFTTKDADIYRWVILTVWPNELSATNFDNSLVFKNWKKISTEVATLYLSPLSSKGTWRNKEPFGDPKAHRWDGPVLSITRARIKTSMWRRFQTEVPPVSKSLHASAGLLTAFGIGEAPVGLQGTVSIWQSNKELTEFAQREQAHRSVITKTHELDWYSEELFARFAIIAVEGALNGVALASSIQVK